MDVKRGYAPGVAALAAGLLVLAGCDLGAPATRYAAPGGVVGTGDIDGDGDLDLVTLGNDDDFGVLVGDGTGGFVATTVAQATECDSGDPAATCTNVRVGDVADVNDDDRADVVVSYSFRNNQPPPSDQEYTATTVRLADGAGGFGPPTSIPAGTLDDVTGDGIVDVVAISDVPTTPTTITVHPGDGSGSFGSPVVSTLPGQRVPHGTGVADLDEDGHPDLVVDGTCVQGSGEQLLRACADVLLGDGTGAFPTSTRLTVPNPQVDGVAVAIGDVDGDGDLDLVGGNLGSDLDGGPPVGSLSLFHGDGDGGFGPEVTVPAFRQSPEVQLADFDVDGHLDLLTTTDDSDFDQSDDFGRILFGDGAGQFSDVHLLPTGRGVLADFDADGKPDFASSTATDTVDVFLNRWDGRPD